MLKRLFIRICKIFRTKQYHLWVIRAATFVVLFIEIGLLIATTLFVMYANDTSFLEDNLKLIFILNFILISVIYFSLAKKFKQIARELE